MAAVGRAHCSNLGGMPRSREPVMDRRPDPTPLHRRLARTMMAGDEQQKALTARDGLIEAAVDDGPSRVEVHAVQVNDAVRRGGSASQLLVPAAVESLFSDRNRLLAVHWCGACRRPSLEPLGRNFGGPFGIFRKQPFARKRPDCRGDPGPKLRLFRAERAHAPRHPWARGSAPARWPTCRRRLPPPRHRRPSKCRSGLAP